MDDFSCGEFFTFEKCVVDTSIVLMNDCFEFDPKLFSSLVATITLLFRLVIG